MTGRKVGALDRVKVFQSGSQGLRRVQGGGGYRARNVGRRRRPLAYSGLPPAITGVVGSALIRFEKVVEDGLDHRVELRGVADVNHHAQPSWLGLGLGLGLGFRV